MEKWKNTFEFVSLLKEKYTYGVSVNKNAELLASEKEGMSWKQKLFSETCRVLFTNLHTSTAG